MLTVQAPGLPGRGLGGIWVRVKELNLSYHNGDL